MSQLSLPSLCFELFEITGQKLYEVFEFVVHNPIISKIVNRKKRKDTKRKVIRRSFSNEGGSRKRKTRGERKAVFSSRAVSYVEDTENDLMFGADLMAEDDYQLPQPSDVEALLDVPPSARSSEVDMHKIDQLELELQRLRSEMAKFMQPAPSKPDEPEVTPPPVTVAPPAPPPPPPVMPGSGKLARVQQSSPADTSEDQIKPALSVTQLIAQGLVGQDKLRKVDGTRSPGGTIQRAATPSATPRTDPASIIAAALHQKFRNVRGNHSIESSPEVHQSDRKREVLLSEPTMDSSFTQRLDEIEIAIDC